MTRFAEKSDIAYSKQPVCNNCKNKLRGLQCRAFDRIPDDILYGRSEHKKPYKDQKNDLIYEPIVIDDTK
jgi:hypothetical protein